MKEESQTYPGTGDPGPRRGLHSLHTLTGNSFTQETPLEIGGNGFLLANCSSCREVVDNGGDPGC